MFSGKEHPLGQRYITTDQVREILEQYRKDLTPDYVERLTNSFNACFNRYEIDTCLRISHFVGQMIHESGAFRYKEEIWRDTPAQKSYEGRKSLGNDEPGDGYKYRGRGYIQLTGKKNYQVFSEAMGIDFVANPDLVLVEPYPMMSAGWYWKKRRLNRWADDDNGAQISLRINGHGFMKSHDARMRKVEHVKKIMSC